MITEQRALEMIRHTLKLNEKINLKVRAGTACWSCEPDKLTPINWKHIGYVSALAYAFDINEVEVLK